MDSPTLEVGQNSISNKKWLKEYQQRTNALWQTVHLWLRHYFTRIMSYVQKGACSLRNQKKIEHINKWHYKIAYSNEKPVNKEGFVLKIFSSTEEETMVKNRKGFRSLAGGELASIRSFLKAECMIPDLHKRSLLKVGIICKISSFTSVQQHPHWIKGEGKQEHWASFKFLFTGLSLKCLIW